MEHAAKWSKKVIIVGFGLLFILVPLILTPWNYELFEYNKMMVTYGLTSLIVGAWIVNMVATGSIRIQRTPLDIPIALFVLSQLVSSIFSMDPHVSWFGYYSRFNGGLLSVLTYVALYYAFVSNFSIGQLRITNSQLTKTKSAIQNLSSENHFVSRLIQTMLITGLIVSLYGVAEHFGIDKHLWVQDVQNRVFSTLGQPNWLAAYLIALIPVSLAMGLAQTSVLSSVWYYSLSVLFFITVLWTRSRSGFVALAIADIAFWGLILAGLFLAKQRTTLKKILFPCLFIHITFFLIIIINGTYIQQVDDWVTIRAWQNRLSQIAYRKSTTQLVTSTESALPQTSTQSASALIQSGVTDSGDIRKYVWEGAINAWKSSPKALLIGTGTETFAFAFYQYKPVGHNLTSEWDFLYNKAHNEYLNFLATTGIFGLGTYLIIISTFIIWSIKVYCSAFIVHRKNAESQQSINDELLTINVGLLAGWISVLITNFFGFSVVVTQLFFYLFPAMMFCCQADTTNNAILFKLQWTFSMKKIVGWGAGIISGLIIISVCVAWYADKEFARGYHLSRAGYLPQAYQSLTSAIRFNPTEPMYHDEQGNVLATLAAAAWKENQATMAGELTMMSIRENDTSLSISPHNVNFWKTRTKIFYALSDIDPAFITEAIKALEKGIDLSPSDPKMQYNLGILYGQADLKDKSLDAMKKSIDLKPNYREGYYGLYLMNKETGHTDEAIQTVKDYLQKVDPKDEEFQKLIQS